MSAHDRLMAAWKAAEFDRYNLAVLGATGVGKSTLINAVFGFREAPTGVGAPVTKGVRFHAPAESSLGLYDFEGAESFAALREFVHAFDAAYRERITVDPAQAIHGVWFCLKASDRRFDDQQAALVHELAGMGLPVVLVVTQTPWKPGIGYSRDAGEFLRYLSGLDLPIVGGEAVPVAAVDDPFTGARAHGLDRLVRVTEAAAPQGHAAAFAAAQRIDLELKRAASRKVIALATAAAAGVGAAPIPIPDALPLAGIQTEMMRRITTIYNISLGQEAVSALLGQLLTQWLGRVAATNLLKFIPGAGTAINASVAGTLTGGLGAAWQTLCERDATGQVDLHGLIRDNELSGVLFGLFTDFVKRRA
ncbi:MAG TPA: DUF697 domain-containing protein [Arachnia sp.]|nr:DUF697 domain-containing protein [Arachnia sp.]HMT86468.1 DUF697 domain-containing protein [Arachnia sp.]